MPSTAFLPESLMEGEFLLLYGEERNLSSNNFQGSIPIELSRIGNLDTLDISNNNIVGSIPSSIGDLEHLLKLNLSRNHLTGFIPAEFGNLRSVMDIDLSNNKLSGLIPEELSQLQNMISLRLEMNKLSGDVSSLVNCLSLSLINVSYNNLVGVIPTSNNFSRFSPDSFIGNPGLCGYWLDSSCQGSQPTKRGQLNFLAQYHVAPSHFCFMVFIVIKSSLASKDLPMLILVVILVRICWLM